MVREDAAGKNWENLANAIVLTAAKDFKAEERSGGKDKC